MTLIFRRKKEFVLFFVWPRNDAMAPDYRNTDLDQRKLLLPMQIPIFRFQNFIKVKKGERKMQVRRRGKKGETKV